MTKRLQLAGRKFGHLTVLSFAGTVNNKSAWLCQCDCEKKTKLVVRGDALTTGNTSTCGCSATETGEKAHAFKHGHSYGVEGRAKATPEYHSWQSMLGRCYNPKNNRYLIYGAEGVQVCNRWNFANGGAFVNFLADVGEKPEPKRLYSMGRYLDTGNYEPGNCEWMSPAEQWAEKRGKKAMLAYREFYKVPKMLISAAVNLKPENRRTA